MGSLPHTLFQNRETFRNQTFRKGNLLDGTGEVVDPAGEPAPVGPSEGVAAMSRENTPFNSRRFDCDREVAGAPERRVQANRDDLFDFVTGVLGQLAQPSVGILLDGGGWRELRLQDDRWGTAELNKNIGAQSPVAEDISLLGRHAPSRVPAVQSTGQDGIYQRFRVSGHPLPFKSQAGSRYQSNLPCRRRR
ncbi:MAG: hypothetical protein OXU32_07755 [Gammaproteobacteria bacterium]|nr:hypothetical protein [Gammaproteobacteria bacterium]